MADRDDFNNPTPHQAPKKSVVDAVIDGAIKAGSGAVSLLSGLLAAVLIIYSGYVLYDTLNIERSAFSSAWDLLQFKPELIEDYNTPMASTALADINKDYRAWLTVYDTNIDYPVMQGPDDLYYAFHDVYKRDSLTGAIYLAAGNSPDFSDSYNLIYGHHMDNGAMFGGLDSFLDGGYFDAHRTGTVITPIGAFDIEIFAAISTDAYESRIYSVGNRMDDVLAFLRSGGAGGVGLGTTVHHFDAELAATAEKVIALSTCAAGDGTSGRLVVFGKLSEHIVYTSLTVAKQWDDGDNQDGKRPAQLTVRLMSGGTEVTSVTLNEGNGWTATVDNIPAYRNWTPILYTWEEDSVDGYTLTGSVTEETTTTFTNSHVPETTALAVAKQWDDDNNRDGLRPASLSVTLRADGENVASVTLNRDNAWTASVENLPVYRAGTPISYTWEEAAVSGYAARQETDGALTVITNTHEIETTTLTVTKQWQDEDNQDGLRPERVTAILSVDGTPIRSLELNAQNEWTATVSGLPVYEGGARIAYSWSEAPVAGYAPTVEADGTATTLINTHVPATKSLTVVKVWDDGDNQDGTRPVALQVTLSDGTVVRLAEENDWTATVEDLPVYAGGREIEYTWTEEEVEGYELVSTVSDGSRTVITNCHAAETTIATVVKVWDDDGNRDGLRPESVTMTLSDGQTRVLSAENHWTATVTGLPMYSGGQPIVYTWTEEQVEGYTAASAVSGTTTTITNTHEPGTVDLTVTKVWDDADNQDGLRPDSVTVTLSDGTQLTLSEDNAWTATVTGLPVYEGGQMIEYTWAEEPVPGYTLSAETDGSAAVLTNTHEPETAALSVAKVWDDDGNRDGVRPEALEVTLLADGEPVGTVTLTEAGGWADEISGLPVNREGKAITYEWRETAVDGYELTGSTTVGGHTVLTNRHAPDTATLTLTKVWDDDDNRDGLRPATLPVTLSAGGEVIFTSTLTPADQWTVTVPGLPVTEDGAPIQYTWAEAEVPGYTLTETVSGTATTFTNTHEIAETTRTVIKVWNDNNNQDGARPSTLTVTLSADGEPVRTVTLGEDNDWRATVTGLPLNADGEEIEYTWTEAAVTDYRLTGVSTVGTTTTDQYAHAGADHGFHPEAVGRPRGPVQDPSRLADGLPDAGRYGDRHGHAVAGQQLDRQGERPAALRWRAGADLPLGGTRRCGLYADGLRGGRVSHDHHQYAGPPARRARRAQADHLLPLPGWPRGGAYL